MLLIERRFTFLVVGIFAALTAACSADSRDPQSERTSSRLENACTEGDERLADDGCNTCQCANGVWSCTELACVGENDGDGTAAPCTEEGDDGLHDEVSNEDSGACVDGEATVAEDGCNTCECIGGAWSCTELACGN